MQLINRLKCLFLGHSPYWKFKNSTGLRIDLKSKKEIIGDFSFILTNPIHGNVQLCYKCWSLYFVQDEYPESIDEIFEKPFQYEKINSDNL